MKIPSMANFSCFAVIPDTTNFQTLALYLTNVPVSSGVGLNSYQLITTLLGFSPATNTAAKLLATLNFQPATNTATGILTPLSFQPATNSATGILTPLNFQPATNSAVGILTPLNFQPATNSAVGILTPLNFQPATNSLVGITTPLGFTPANAANTNDFARTTANGLSQSIGARSDVKVITNGLTCYFIFKTNNLPGAEFTNAPTGSILTTTNGGIYVLSNIVWQAIVIP